MPHRTYTIRDLAREFSVTTRAIRFYEDKGLLSPARRGQARIYAPRDHARLSLILRGKRVGFSLDEIREMLDLYDLKDGQAAQLHVSRRKFAERIEILEQQKNDIAEAITELHDVCDLVDRMLEEKAAEVSREVKLVTSAAGFAGPVTMMVRNDDYI